MNYNMKRIKDIKSRDYEVGDGYMVTIRKEVRRGIEQFSVYVWNQDYGNMVNVFGLPTDQESSNTWAKAEEIAWANLPDIIEEFDDEVDIVREYTHELNERIAEEELAKLESEGILNPVESEEADV